jgi:hypothetical protein
MGEVNVDLKSPLNGATAAGQALPVGASTVGTQPVASWSRYDWKGWLAVAWVLWWGAAYVVTVLEARAPQLLIWLRSWSAGH